MSTWGLNRIIEFALLCSMLAYYTWSTTSLESRVIERTRGALRSQGNEK